MNTRKKCIACGLIGFAAEDICRRCGSNKLFKIGAPETLQKSTPAAVGKKTPFWIYLICFVFACIIEFAALLPVLANIGWRHTANAPISEFERNSHIAAFVLHLPTSILFYLFSYIDGGISFLLAPLTQIAFWTILFSYFWRKIKNKFF